MIETVKIQFYKITRCGYYRYGSDEPEFGDISDILDQLMDWVTAGHKTLAETCTYELDAGEDSHRAFCFDIRKNQRTDDVVLVTWNETPTNEGRVVTVNGQQPVGDAEVSFTNLPEGSIPGYATYFWFVPDQNVFAALRFHHTLLVGRANLERYLREYCAKFTSYVVVEEEDDGAEILGYAEGDGEPENLRPNFKSCVYRKPGQVDFIRRNVGSITKVTRKNKVRSENLGSSLLIVICPTLDTARLTRLFTASAHPQTTYKICGGSNPCPGYSLISLLVEKSDVRRLPYGKVRSFSRISLQQSAGLLSNVLRDENRVARL